MKKMFLIASLVFAGMGSMAQSSNNVGISTQNSEVRSVGNILIVDSSYHKLDTLYSVSGNSKTLYRTIRSRFVTYDNQSVICLYCVKEVLIDNKAWRFYSLSVEPFINKNEYPGIIFNNNLFTH